MLCLGTESPPRLPIRYKMGYMEFVAQLAERLIVVQVVVGSSPTKLPNLGYRITVNISDSDSDDCGSNPCVPTN